MATILTPVPLYLTLTQACLERGHFTEKTEIMKLAFVRAIIICSALSFLNACTYQYARETTDNSLQLVGLQSAYSVDRDAQWVLHSATGVALARPHHIQARPMPRHLTQMHHALDFALQQAFPDYAALDEAVSLDAALMRAKSLGKELLFWPELVRSENKLNTSQELIEGQSLNPDQDYGTDRIVFHMRIYEIRTQRLLDVGRIIARGRFFAPENSAPTDLFEQAALEYVKAITGKQAG